MPAYESYIKTVRTIQSILVEKTLKPVAFRQFKQDRGVSVREVLPDRSSEYDFNAYGFDGFIDPDRRTLESPVYEPGHLTLSPNRIAADPHACKSLVDDLYTAWWETFGEKTMAYQKNHPGEPPVAKDDLQNSIDQLATEFDNLCRDPSLDDLLGSIRDKNYRLAARFLGFDDPQQFFTPGGGHELAELFTNGDIHIVFQDDDIAVLKPEYDFDTRAEVLSERRPVGERVRFRGEVPEPAFVVGLDDTPVGLFAHSIDGTRLDHTQEITREYLHDVMGFDVNYDGDDRIELDVGERMRLQGDLAVRRVETTASDQLPDRCNLPIDNHLAILTDAALPENESLSEEPIRVNVPRGSTINVVHDEHEHVVSELSEGAYEFYLLPRGLQPADERPNWPEPAAPLA